MPKLKKNQIYLSIEKHYDNFYSARFYICDLETKFEAIEKDWNCDDDVYKIKGVYLLNYLDTYRDFISEDLFNKNFYEYTRNTNNNVLYLSIVNMTAIKILAEVIFEKEKLYILGLDENYTEVVTEKFFKEKYKKIELLD